MCVMSGSFKSFQIFHVSIRLNVLLSKLFSCLKYILCDSLEDAFVDKNMV